MDISLRTLESLVKTIGDECVTGFVRFKKIRKCNGYKDAGCLAAKRLSKIKGGRIIGPEQYAAVIRFRWFVFIIPITVVLIGILLYSIMPSALERSATEKDYPDDIITIAETIEPESVIPDIQENEFRDLYISVPGFSDIYMNDEYHSLKLYNPAANQCLMMYEIYVGDEYVADTDMLSPGGMTEVDFYDRLVTGSYRLKIMARAFALDKTTEFNSVVQEIKLSVKREV